MGAFFSLRDHIQISGRGRVVTAILLFGIGCGYDFTERRKESDSTGVISSGIKSEERKL